MSFPQCCSLQSSIISPNNDDWTWVNKINPERLFIVICRKGRDWLTTSFLFTIDGLKSYHLQQHGPATTREGMGMQCEQVNAVYCFASPADCLVLLQRPRPGHWPKKETLTKAKQFGVFLMNPGTLAHSFDFDSSNYTGKFVVRHPYDYASVQCRMSTNLTERLLMFDLNLIQMKTYTVTKMIKKEILYPLVGDGLSSFHMKMALLFTVEQFPEMIWTDDNIVQCVLYSLNTLRRFVKRRHCPHYTIAKVDVFSGKLQKHNFQSLNDKLKALTDSKLSCIFSLQMDQIGERISGNPTAQNANIHNNVGKPIQINKNAFCD
ncbi:hypothetical protein DPMN_156064 [Dreissena polymorpha]|uniref:Mab-21-like HhH/H2TH-like domain-containing protein n=1 Tax=Dreissena polymorpha TaxID=45954 RepID=A0A9D4FP31_DREPO|nr:hypothetical protein DPMN_156064 [Dreissena polymorpha]